MDKQLQSKYKFQTFFEQVTEIIEKHDEAFINRIRFKSSVDFIDKMDKFFLYVENNCFQAVDIKIGRIPVPKEYIEERFKAYHRIPMRSRFEPIAKDIIRELQLSAPNLELTTTDKNNIKAEIKRCFLAITIFHSTSHSTNG